jgi:hypothetical protein
MASPAIKTIRKTITQLSGFAASSQLMIFMGLS